MCKLQIVPNLTTPENQCTLCTGPGQRLRKLTGTPGPFGPLTSHCYGSIEGACWSCYRQFAVFSGWTPQNALFLLQHDPISPWTALSFPANQSGLPCPAGIGQESGKRDRCHGYFHLSWRNSPFALAILSYVHSRYLGNIRNSTAQPSQALWDWTRVAHPWACQNWMLDSLLIACYWDTMPPHTYEAKITLASIWFSFMEKEWEERRKPQEEKRGKGGKKNWSRERGTWSNERKAERVNSVKF